jgi:Zn-finger nucleic acid-binding protein
MNCPDCGAPMHLVPDQDYYICDYCSNTYSPPAGQDGVKDLGTVTELVCPRCAQAALVSGALNNVPLWLCRGCRGILLTMANLAVIASAAESRHRSDAITRPPDIRPEECRLPCPRCRLPMNHHPYYAGPAHLMVDGCEHCDLIWLDRPVFSDLL